MILLLLEPRAPLPLFTLVSSGPPSSPFFFTLSGWPRTRRSEAGGCGFPASFQIKRTSRRHIGLVMARRNKVGQGQEQQCHQATKGGQGAQQRHGGPAASQGVQEERVLGTLKWPGECRKEQRWDSMRRARDPGAQRGGLGGSRRKGGAAAAGATAKTAPSSGGREAATAAAAAPEGEEVVM